MAQDSLLSRAPISKLIGKQLQVSGDAESINEHASAATKSVAEPCASAYGTSTPMLQESADPPAKPDKDSSLLHKRAHVEVADFEQLGKDSITLSVEGSQLTPSQIALRSPNPKMVEVEDVNEVDEQALIANKIRISHIKGSHTTIAAPSPQHVLPSAPGAGQGPLFLGPNDKRHTKLQVHDYDYAYRSKQLPKQSKVTISHP